MEEKPARPWTHRVILIGVGCVAIAWSALYVSQQLASQHESEYYRALSIAGGLGVALLVWLTCREYLNRR